jgi:tetratricopeptide (TPR) repeat protein
MSREIGEHLIEMRRPEEAAANFADEVESAREFLRLDPKQPSRRAAVASALVHLLEAKRLADPEVKAGGDLEGEASSLLEAAHADAETRPEDLAAVGEAYLDLASYRERMSEMEGSLAAATSAAEIYERLASDDAHRPEHLLNAGVARQDLARVTLLRDRKDAAIQEYENALEHFQRLTVLVPHDPRATRALVSTHIALAHLEGGRGNDVEDSKKPDHGRRSSPKTKGKIPPAR